MLTKNEHQLIGLIYDAALEPSLWSKALEQIVQLSNSNTAIITALDHLNPDYSLAFTHNIAQSALDIYREEHLDAVDMEYHGKQMIYQGIGNPWQLCMEAYKAEKYLNTPIRNFYDKCLAPSNIHYMTGTLLEYSQYHWCVLGVHRPEWMLAFAEKEFNFFAEIGKHIRRSLQIYRQLAAAHNQNTQLYQILDQMSLGIILLNEKQQVRYANAKAEKLLSQRKVLRVDATRQLKTSVKQQGRLNQLIRSTLFGLEHQITIGKAGGIIDLRNEYDEVELILTITPLSAIDSYREIATNNIQVAIFLTDPKAKYTLSHQLLEQLYQLSKRESHICEVFINYPTLEQTAEACGLTLASVRTYMKNIYEKTQQHSQAELLHLLMALTNRFEHIQ